MRLTPHPESDRLKQALRKCLKLAAPWAGVTYRSAAIHYANRDDLLTGAGSKIEGARWNPPESVSTVYTALEIQTAVEEALAHHRYYGYPEQTALPRVLVSIRVSLQRVLNLTNQRLRRSLGVSRDQLLRDDWRLANESGQESMTQAIGRLAWDAEWEGLLAPSAAHPGGVNLVIFPGNLSPPDSYSLIINRDQLPSRL
jgi:RES domain-containing protein